jgi:hypothetical protein
LVAQGQIKGDSGESQGVCARVVNGEGSGYLNGPGAPPPTRHERQRPVGFVSPKRRPAEICPFGAGTNRSATGGSRWLCSAKTRTLGPPFWQNKPKPPFWQNEPNPSFWQNEPKKLNDYRCAGSLRRREATPRPCGFYCPAVPPHGDVGHWDSPPRRSIVPNPTTWNGGTAGGRRKPVPCPAALAKLGSGTRDRNNIEDEE